MYYMYVSVHMEGGVDTVTARTFLATCNKSPWPAICCKFSSSKFYYQ